MNRDAVDDAWTATDWQSALALVWHHKWTDSDRSEKDFLAALFTLLRELQGHTTKVGRREVNARLLALIKRHPELDNLLEVGLMYREIMDDAPTDDAVIFSRTPITAP